MNVFLPRKSREIRWWFCFRCRINQSVADVWYHLHLHAHAHTPSLGVLAGYYGRYCRSAESRYVINPTLCFLQFVIYYSSSLCRMLNSYPWNIMYLQVPTCNRCTTPVCCRYGKKMYYICPTVAGCDKNKIKVGTRSVIVTYIGATYVHLPTLHNVPNGSNICVPSRKQ